MTGVGRPVDYPGAARLLEKAVAADIPSAKSNLAYLLRNGLGVERDLTRAFSLYKSSADQGFPEAFGPLAECYEFGEGVPENAYLALQYYKRAALAGDARAAQRCRELASVEARPLASSLSRNPEKKTEHIDFSLRDALARKENAERRAAWKAQKEKERQEKAKDAK